MKEITISIGNEFGESAIECYHKTIENNQKEIFHFTFNEIRVIMFNEEEDLIKTISYEFFLKYHQKSLPEKLLNDLKAWRTIDEL